MTTKEAIQAMLDGKKVKKDFWESDCFCKFDGNRFTDKLGRVLYSFGECFWEIYEEPKPKQTVTIERWLCKNSDDGEYRVIQTSDIELATKGGWKTIKLIDTYEVEL